MRGKVRGPDVWARAVLSRVPGETLAGPQDGTKMGQMGSVHLTIDELKIPRRGCCTSDTKATFEASGRRANIDSPKRPL